MHSFLIGFEAGVMISQLVSLPVIVLFSLVHKKEMINQIDEAMLKRY